MVANATALISPASTSLQYDRVQHVPEIERGRPRVLKNINSPRQDAEDCSATILRHGTATSAAKYFGAK